MQPPETASARSTLSCLQRLRGSEPRIGKIQALDQDADEGTVEFGAAGGRSLLERAHVDAHDARVAARGDRRAALLRALREVGHLAEALAGTEQREELLVLGDAHLAFHQHAEELARLALA